jgi:hypothetical protein
MTTSLRINTRVLPGRRIEISSPELTEGEMVQVSIALGVGTVVHDRVLAVLADLAENAREVIQEGGESLAPAASAFIEQAAMEIVRRALNISAHSLDDIRLTPFARSDGGAHLLVDFGPTDRRLSLHVLPTGQPAALTLTSATSSHSELIELPTDMAMHLTWLTKRAG